MSEQIQLCQQSKQICSRKTFAGPASELEGEKEMKVFPLSLDSKLPIFPGPLSLLTLPRTFHLKP